MSCDHFICEYLWSTHNFATETDQRFNFFFNPNIPKEIIDNLITKAQPTSVFGPGICSQRKRLMHSTEIYSYDL